MKPLKEWNINFWWGLVIFALTILICWLFLPDSWLNGDSGVNI